MDARLREAFRFFLAHAGYATPPGRAMCALRLARAELRAADLNEDGMLRYVVEPEVMDPADSFEDKRDIDAIRSGALEWEAFALEVRTDHPCDHPGCDGCAGWEVRAAVGGVAYKRGDGYDRVIKAELALEADLPSEADLTPAPRYLAL